MARKKEEIGRMVEVTMLLVALAGLAVILAIGVHFAVALDGTEASGAAATALPEAETPTKVDPGSV